jgi:hypothetical protein
MRVLLRHPDIGLYYAGPKHWASDPEAALDLGSIEHATELSREEDFSQMEIVVNYDDPFCELVLPLGPCTSALRPQRSEAVREGSSLG